MTPATRKSRRVLEGKVLSTKMQKTIVVEVERTFRHAKYGKYLRKRKRYHAHDEQQSAKTGDRVELAATRPLSKSKRWRLLRVIERGEQIEATSAEGEAKLDLGAETAQAGGAQ